MKVSELIQILQQYDSDTPVHFSASNNNIDNIDYWDDFRNWNLISCPRVTEVIPRDLQPGFEYSDLLIEAVVIR